MIKKRDVIFDADDDEVRTNASQNRGTASLCTEEFFPRSQYMQIALSSYQQGGVGDRI
jgi:hypothetical protein